MNLPFFLFFFFFFFFFLPTLDLIMSTLASDSSLDSRRSCPNYNSRVSSVNYDRHEICVTCHEQDCDVDNKCIECSL